MAINPLIFVALAAIIIILLIGFAIYLIIANRRNFGPNVQNVYVYD